MITIRKSSIHSKGVFAKKDITKSTRVIEYVGEKITGKESEKRVTESIKKNKSNQRSGAVYIFELNKKHDIDGNVSYNKARLINHSCDPNCETDIIRGKIWIIAIKDIKKGEEISYNYGYDFEDYLDHPCYCRTNRCVNYILSEDHWEKLPSNSSN